MSIFRRTVLEFLSNKWEIFVVEEHFAISACSEARPRICYMNDEFKKLFLPLVEKVKKESRISYFVRGELFRSCDDAELFKEHKFDPVNLADIFYLISQQGEGEKGILHTKRFSWKANIFYIKDLNGLSRFIFVSFDRKKKGWSIVSREVNFLDSSKSLSRGSNFFYKSFL